MVPVHAPAQFTIAAAAYEARSVLTPTARSPDVSTSSILLPDEISTSLWRAARSADFTSNLGSTELSFINAAVHLPAETHGQSNSGSKLHNSSGESFCARSGKSDSEESRLVPCFRQ